MAKQELHGGEGKGRREHTWKRERIGKDFPLPEASCLQKTVLREAGDLGNKCTFSLLSL